jgi:predicted metal-dependent phosphoesterase TrpH
MYNKADLHLHTLASDGKLTPEELVDKAKSEKLDVIAITDHDTTAGVNEGIEYGKKTGIKVIPGIELSTTHNNESIHILGYFRDAGYNDTTFKNTIQDMVDYRVTRGKEIVHNLEYHFDIKLDFQKILNDAKGIIARPHIAKAIIEEGYDYEWEYIFNHIIDEDGPVYVPKKNLSITEGIELLRSVNCLVVLAHPVLISKSPVEDILSYPFDGIEAVYHLNSKEDTEKFRHMAHVRNKIVTAGSDYHGIDKKDNAHGTVGSVSLQGEELARFMSYF